MRNGSIADIDDPNATDEENTYEDMAADKKEGFIRILERGKQGALKSFI